MSPIGKDGRIGRAQEIIQTKGSPAKNTQVIFPADCTLLPLSSGKLLVSPGHTVFCRIPPAEQELMEAVIAGQAALGSLSQALLKDLGIHGFFDPPRPPREDPPTVQIQLTNACNLACEYCCTNSGRARAREVGFEQMLQVVRQIPQALGPHTAVALLGGEPLLVPWSLDLATEIQALGLPLTIFSNGMSLTNSSLAERTTQLVRRGAQVRISLSGPSPETCDPIAGKGRFEAALSGIHNLAALGARVTVDLMFMPQQVEAIIRELPAFRPRLPPDTQITFGILYWSGRETGQHLFEGRAALEAALDRVAFEAGEIIPAAENRPLAFRREGCNCALGKHINVRSDGALFNCFKMEEKIGHLNADGFPAAVEWLHEHPHRACYLPTCAGCPLVTMCGGGCRAENLLYSGNPDEPPCGPWRVRVLSELLAEDRVSAVEWSLAFLLQEARRRGIGTPGGLEPKITSRHLVEV